MLFSIVVLFITYLILWGMAGGWLDPVTRQQNIKQMLIQLAIGLAGLFFWMAFFSQFILPLDTIRKRLKIIRHLFLHIFRQHGPAVFIENGIIRERADEEERRGPGLIWLDTASAAVLRTAVRFTRAVGPGVYFTGRYERIAGTVDLHKQNQMIGPRGDEDPFIDAPADDSEEAQMAFAATKKRAQETLALTRDDIEIIPNIIVIFKIKSQPAKGNQPGSRFGYNAESVRRAITSNSIDPTREDSESRHVMWNEMPAYIAADVWREMLNKYRLEDLFHPLPFEIDLGNPPEELRTADQPDASTPEKPPTPLQALWWEISGWLAQQIQTINHLLFGSPETEPAEAEKPATPRRGGAEMPERETVMNFIQRMVRARLAQRLAPVLDNNGRPTGEWFESPEFKEMERRGISVLAVIITNLRFRPAIEKRLVDEWTTNWLDDAQQRSLLIENQIQEIENLARYAAQADFAETLASETVRAAGENCRHTFRGRLKCLQKVILLAMVRRAHRIGRDHVILRNRLTSEMKRLEEIARQIDEAMQQDRGCP